MALLRCHLALAELHHLVHQLVHPAVVGGVDDTDVGDIKAALFRGGLHLLRDADEEGLQDAVLLQAGGRLQNAGVGPLGKDQGRGILFELFNQVFKHNWYASNKMFRF